MRKSFLLLPLLFCLLQINAQNLVANGNFEDRNICTEFGSGCAPEAWFRVPLLPVTSGMGTAGFYHGNKFESVVMENTGEPFTLRSFVYTRLLCSLDSGKVYRFRSSVRTSEFDFDHLDILMLPYEPYRNKQKLAVTKQKYTITVNQKVQDRDDDWKDYLLEFTATGKELYMVIGNFSKEVLGGRPLRGPVNVKVLYDIDNVSVLPLDSTRRACAEWKNNKTRLYQNNSRHTINNFLDEEPEVTTPEPEEPKKVVPSPIPAPVVNDTLIIPDVLFRFNSSELNPLFSNRLDTLVSKIKGRDFKSIEVIGHTDSLGTNAFNQNLSLHRAETVKKYLSEKLQYPSSSITTKGMAAMVPVASNKTAAGRQRNRRVEIVLVREVKIKK